MGIGKSPRFVPDDEFHVKHLAEYARAFAAVKAHRISFKATKGILNQASSALMIAASATIAASLIVVSANDLFRSKIAYCDQSTARIKTVVEPLVGSVTATYSYRLYEAGTGRLIKEDTMSSPSMELIFDELVPTTNYRIEFFTIDKDGIEKKVDDLTFTTDKLPKNAVIVPPSSSVAPAPAPAVVDNDGDDDNDDGDTNDNDNDTDPAPEPEPDPVPPPEPVPPPAPAPVPEPVPVPVPEPEPLPAPEPEDEDNEEGGGGSSESSVAPSVELELNSDFMPEGTITLNDCTANDIESIMLTYLDNNGEEQELGFESSDPDENVIHIMGYYGDAGADSILVDGRVFTLTVYYSLDGVSSHAAKSCTHTDEIEFGELTYNLSTKCLFLPIVVGNNVLDYAHESIGNSANVTACGYYDITVTVNGTVLTAANGIYVNNQPVEGGSVLAIHGLDDYAGDTPLANANIGVTFTYIGSPVGSKHSHSDSTTANIGSGMVINSFDVVQKNNSRNVQYIADVSPINTTVSSITVTYNTVDGSLPPLNIPELELIFDSSDNTYKAEPSETLAVINQGYSFTLEVKYDGGAKSVTRDLVFDVLPVSPVLSDPEMWVVDNYMPASGFNSPAGSNCVRWRLTANDAAELAEAHCTLKKENDDEIASPVSNMQVHDGYIYCVFTDAANTAISLGGCKVSLGTMFTVQDDYYNIIPDRYVAASTDEYIIPN